MTQTYAQRIPETSRAGQGPQRDLSAEPGPMPSFLGGRQTPSTRPPGAAPPWRRG